MTTETDAPSAKRPNLLILCMDQWQTHMKVPDAVEFPALRRLEERGVTFDKQYCTVPICTPSRSTMWTGVHAVHTGLWDNTNYAWTAELREDIPTVGHMLREQGYYTAFKGKWHLSEVPLDEDALERYGFSDYQQWGDVFGAPLQGQKLDGTAASETVDWLEHRGNSLDKPWLLVSSLVNPHDIMFLQTDPVQAADPNGTVAGMQTHVQKTGWFQHDWGVTLPENFDDDLEKQPPGVAHYKDIIDRNYGRIPDDREDLWRKYRNYLVNCMRLADAQFGKILNALDRLNLWENTVVLFMSDHGEMNGAHRMTQKGNIPFDEAAVVNLTVCTPDGPRGQRTAAVGSHLDLAPTLLSFAGLSDEEIEKHYPHLKGRSLHKVVFKPTQNGPRGSADAPGDGALITWDGLSLLDADWSVSGAVQTLTDLGSGADKTPEEAGKLYGAPDFSKRNFFRAVADGRYKLVRWFSPEEYSNPETLAELQAHSDVALYDLENDPGELQNLAHADHPEYDSALIEGMLGKLHALIKREIGDDRCPFSLELFGTREVKESRGSALEGT